MLHPSRQTETAGLVAGVYYSFFLGASSVYPLADRPTLFMLGCHAQLRVCKSPRDSWAPHEVVLQPLLQLTVSALCSIDWTRCWQCRHAAQTDGESVTDYVRCLKRLYQVAYGIGMGWECTNCDLLIVHMPLCFWALPWSAVAAQASSSSANVLLCSLTFSNSS